MICLSYIIFFQMRRKQNATQLMLIAQQCFRKKQYANAIKVLNQVIELQQRNDQAYRLLGDSFEQLGEPQQAQKNYKLGLDCNPLSSLCYINYGLLLYNQGRKEEAEKIYEISMNIDPNDPIVLNNYSTLLFQLGKFDKAEQISKACLKVDPKNEKCAQYIKKIKQSRFRSKRSQTKPARPENDSDKLLQLLWERDLKLAEKQSTIQMFRNQLNKKDNQIKELKAQIQKFKRRQNQQESLRLCKICLHNAAQYANKKCGHLTSCKNCLGFLGESCPICRQPGSFIRVYSSLIREQILF